MTRTRAVSIPFWVSIALRPVLARARIDDEAVFQSRSGFLLPCDDIDDETVTLRDVVSIPFWVSIALR
ncbi:hypothetical protein, partial [Haloferax sulfurifontis]